MLQVTKSPGPSVQQALHPLVRSVISKYAVSAAEAVFPAPKQLPVTSTVWLPAASNGPAVAILGVHNGGEAEGWEDGEDPPLRPGDDNEDPPSPLREDDAPGAVELVSPAARFDVPVTVTTADTSAVPSWAVTTAVPGPVPKTASPVSTTATAELLVAHAAPASSDRGAAWPSLSRPFRASGLLAPWPSCSVAGLTLSERTPMVIGLSRSGKRTRSPQRTCT